MSNKNISSGKIAKKIIFYEARFDQLQYASSGKVISDFKSFFDHCFAETGVDYFLRELTEAKKDLVCTVLSRDEKHILVKYTNWQELSSDLQKTAKKDTREILDFDVILGNFAYFYFDYSINKVAVLLNDRAGGFIRILDEYRAAYGLGKGLFTVSKIKDDNIPKKFSSAKEVNQVSAKIMNKGGQAHKGFIGLFNIGSDILQEIDVTIKLKDTSPADKEHILKLKEDSDFKKIIAETEDEHGINILDLLSNCFVRKTNIDIDKYKTEDIDYISGKLKSALFEYFNSQ